MIILDWRYFCRRYLFDAYLVAVTKEDDGTLTIKNKLEWTNDSPLTAQSVEDWLILNNLYKK